VSRRTEQLSTVIQRAVQQIIAEGIADPRVGGLITVTGVEVTPDAATAVISISVLPEEKQELTMHGLRAAAAFIRREAGELVSVHRLPQFVFKLDKGLKKQAAVLAAIAEAAKDPPVPPLPAETPKPAKTDPNQETPR
jgi:ribosome-binding factor A